MNPETTLAMTTLDWIVCWGALIGSILGGLWMARRFNAAGDSESFFLAGRRLSWPVVGASLFATNIGAEHLVGLSGDSYRYGISAATVEFTTAICLGIACAVLVPAYIRNKIFTVPEFLELRYNRASRLFFSGLMLFICVVTKMAFTLYAGALVLVGLTGGMTSVTDPAVIQSILLYVGIMAAVAALVTIIGGFATVAFTDTLQTLIMLLGCGIMLYIGLDKVGGWSELIAKAPEAMSMHKPYDDPHYPFWGVIIGAIYGGTFYWGMDQVNVQRMLGAPNIKEARWGAMFAILLKLTPVFIFALPGVIASVLYPGREPKGTFVTLLNDMLPTGVRGLVLSALLAAMVSSLLSMMNSISTIVIKDFVLGFAPQTPERRQVVLGRVAIAVAAFCGVVATYPIAITPDGLYLYLQAISIYLVMPIAPAIFFGIVSRRVTFGGALASFVVGLGLATLFVTDQIIGKEGGAEAMFPLLHLPLTANYTYRGMWGTLIIIGVLFAVSAMTRKTAPEKLDRTVHDWSAPAAPFEGLTDWRLQLSGLLVLSAALYALFW